MYHTLSYSKLFVTSDRTRTCIHPSVSRIPTDMCLFCIQPLAVRESVIPHCWITYITHLPKSLGATLPFVHQAIWSGRQDSNLRPLVPKTSVLANWTTSRNVLFFHNTSAQLPWELVSFTITSDFHRRSPRVCTLPLWNSNRLLTYIFIIFNHQCPFLNAFILFW